jgi:hypothetical protein
MRGTITIVLGAVYLGAAQQLRDDVARAKHRLKPGF